MFNNDNGYSLADIAAATNGNNNDGYGFGGGAFWIVILAILFFGGFGGFGNWGGYGNGANGGFGTPQAVSTVNTDYLAQGMRDIQSNLSSNFLTLNNEALNGFCNVQNAIANSSAGITAAVTNGFNTQNLSNLQNTNAIQRDIYSGTVGAMQNTQALQATLAQMASDNRADAAQNAYNQATNTCSINTNASNNTRDIIDAINASNRSILDTMAQNKVDAMQDKINDLTAQLQTANFLASQGRQTNEILQGQNALENRLNPNPIPAYVVQNPRCNCGFNNGLAMVNV